MYSERLFNVFGAARAEPCEGCQAEGLRRSRKQPPKNPSRPGPSEACQSFLSGML